MNALSHAKGRALAVFDSTTLYYVHPDHLDRPVVMTNATAQTIAWQARYDPFGVPVAVTVSPVNNQRPPALRMASRVHRSN